MKTNSGTVMTVTLSCLLLALTGLRPRAQDAAPVETAAENEAPPPTVITADRLDFDYAAMVAHFEGNVRIVDPQFRMQSDQLMVFFEGTNDLRQAVAIGSVVLHDADRSAYCDHAVYHRADEQIVMTGNARLQQGAEQVAGDRITIWLNDQRVLCEPGRLMVRPGARQRDPSADPGERDP